MADTKTVYARTTGSDGHGDGTLYEPYRTFRRAIRDVPHVIPQGFIYVVDITGIGVEQLPPNYQFPAIVAPQKLNFSTDGSVPFPFLFGSSFNVRAFPQPASNIPLADTTVPAAGYNVSDDPVTGLTIITTLTPRLSWAADSLKGKFFTQDGNDLATCVIYGSDATHLRVCTDLDSVRPGADLAIVETSATLQADFTLAGDDLGAIQMMNCPHMALQGLTLRATGPLAADSNAFGFTIGSQPVMSMCEVDGLGTQTVGANFLPFACVLSKHIGADGSSFTAISCLIQDAFFFAAGPAGCFFLSCVLDRCSAIGAVPVQTTLGNYPAAGIDIRLCLFRDGVDPNGAIWALNGGVISVQNVRIDNGAGPGITSEGGSFTVLDTVAGTGNAGVGVRVLDGAIVRVADDPLGVGTTITGTDGDMKVGQLPVRSWLNFRDPAANPPVGMPIMNEYDLKIPFNAVSGTPGGDEETGVGTGGHSGSRLFERPRPPTPPPSATPTSSATSVSRKGSATWRIPRSSAALQSATTTTSTDITTSTARYRG